MVNSSTELDHVIAKHLLEARGVPEAEYPYELRRGYKGWPLWIPLIKSHSKGIDLFDFD
jgi:hypothetical protein